MTKKFVSMFLALVMCLSIPVFATEENPSYDEDYINAKFEELFPEYQEYIQTCNAVAAQTEPIALMGLNSVEEDEAVLTKSITRMDGDDVYTLNLYSDGGYDKIALVGGTATTLDDNGSGNWVPDIGTSENVSGGIKWTGRSVHAYGSRLGITPYSGGMIGENITYTLTSSTSGYFPRTGSQSARFGNYYNTAVFSGDNDNTSFLSTSDSYIEVAGVAEYAWYNDGNMHIMGTPSILTINLNERDSSGNPAITFDIP